MKLNKIEFFLMNNPVRRIIQDKIEIKRLRKLSSLKPGGKYLELGCGNGNGTKLIKKYFSPTKIYAIDLDKRMITLANKSNKDSSIIFEIGDASKLIYKDNSFDAIFDFGVIHHILNWKDSLKELKRVLKKDAELVIEDLSIETFETFFGKLYRKLLDHPYESMYRTNEFVAYMKKIGFKVQKEERYHSMHLIKYFIIIAKK